VNTDEFAGMYGLYRDRVYWYFLGRTGSPEDAADLTQTTFVKAYQAAERYRPDIGPFSAWLFTIARNSAGSFARKRRTISWADMPSGYAETIPAPSRDGLVVTDTERLRRSLAELDPQAQDMLLLRFEAELTVAEVAATIGRSSEATKKALQRTLKKLKEIYDDMPLRV
jgi:RNA polymerase sigma factor (sigma-70 family)